MPVGDRRESGSVREPATASWVTPSAAGRTATTTAVFRLTRPARIRVTVAQLAPACRPVGAFTMRGRAGSNRLLFHRRLHGRRLPPGTYRLTGRVDGRRVVRAIVVVAAERPATVAAGACGAAVSLLGAPIAVRGPLLLSRTSAGTRLPAAAPEEAAVVPHSGVLGASFAKTGRRFDATRALLLADALFAIVLLGLAALPPRALASPRLAVLVETRRAELALAGVATLAVAVLAALVTGS